MDLAVKHLKSGIEGFVDDQARQLQRDLIDSVKKEHPELSKVHCTECTRVEDILPGHVIMKRECLHNRKRGSCNCELGKAPRECPNRVCGILYDMIIMDHYCGNPNWKNTTPAQWTTNHWEVAKCFLQEGTDSYVDKKSARETDAEGLLSICTNSLSMRKHIDDIDTFQMVRSYDWTRLKETKLHTCNTNANIMKTMIDVLSDKKAFDKDVGAMEAVTSIREMMKSITSTAISPARNENPQMKMETIDSDPNSNISTNSDLIDDIHSTGTLNNAQTLTFQNEWNIESYSTVKRASQSLKELTLENAVPLCERSQMCSNDLIRLSHSEASNILTNFGELVKLRLRNVECIPDINCECERIPVNHRFPYVKMQSTRVTCSKSSSDSGKSNTLLKGYEIELNGTVFHNDTLAEAENVEFAFPLTCKKLQALTKITICNMHLSHTQIGCIMCEIPPLQTVDLQNTICTVDTQCGCSNTKSGPIKGTSKIKQFSFSTNVSSTRLETDLGPSVLSPQILCHLEHAPNLTDMTFDGLCHITFLTHYLKLVPNPNSVCRLKLKNTTVDKDTLLGVIHEYKSGLHLTFKHVLVNNPSEDINAQLLNSFKNMDIERWEMASDTCIITYGKLKTKLRSEILLSPCSAWPAYDYTSKHLSHVESLCTALFEKCGLRKLNEQEPLLKRLFRNVKIRVLTYRKTQRQYFDELFNDIKCKSMFSEDNETVAGKFHEKEACDPIFLVATEKELLNVLKTCSLDNITSKIPNYHIVFVKEIDPEVTDVEQTVGKLSEDIPITYTTKENLFNDIDDLLEKYAFETVHKKARTMQYLCSVLKEKQWDTRHLTQYGLALTTDKTPNQCLSDLNKNAAEIRETFSMIGSVYGRSCVPVPKWLSFPEVPDQHSKEEFIQAVLNLGLKNIIGHAENYGTIHFYLDVDLNNPERKVLQNKIGETAQNHFNPSYILHYIHRDVKKLSKVGAKVGSAMVGTLGGFAVTDDNTVETDRVSVSGACFQGVSNVKSDSKNLHALISQHVAMRQAHDVLLYENKVFANVKKPLEGQLDIAVALITKENIPRCVTEFKDESGNHKLCTLFEYESDVKDKVGFIVHIWGAYTSPGLGVICQSNYRATDRKTGKVSDMKPHLIITSRDTGPFCVGGDSGSVVCAVDRRGKMYAIGMLVGEMSGPNEEGNYLALRLHDGFQQLSELHRTEYKLPD